MRGIAALLTEHGIPTTAREDLEEPGESTKGHEEARSTASAE
jgi:hypothetical protein